MGVLTGVCSPILPLSAASCINSLDMVALLQTLDLWLLGREFHRRGTSPGMWVAGVAFLPSSEAALLGCLVWAAWMCKPQQSTPADRPRFGSV
eukprot:711695-Amphidinium_carterae.4